MKRIFLAFLLLTAPLLTRPAIAQVNYTPMPVPKMQFVDQNGIPLAGGLVYTYAAGTSTPQATYTDYTGAVQNANPVVLDSAGRATIFLGSLSYKFVVQNSAGTQQYMVDGVAPVGAIFAAPPAIGATTPGPITGTVIVATTDFNVNGAGGYEVNGSPLNFTNLAGWPSQGIPCVSATSTWCTSYTLTGTGDVVMSTSPTLTTPNIGAATASSLNMTNGPITNTGSITPQAGGTPTLGSTAAPYAAVTVGPSSTANATLSCPTCTTVNSVTVPNVPGGVVVETANAATSTPGTSVTSTTCTTAACTSIRGTIQIVGGTATTGTIATLAWTATPSTYVCSATQNGGAIWYGIGNSVATATGFSITSAVTISGATFSVNYSCQP